MLPRQRIAASMECLHGPQHNRIAQRHPLIDNLSHFAYASREKRKPMNYVTNIRKHSPTLAQLCKSSKNANLPLINKSTIRSPVYSRRPGRYGRLGWYVIAKSLINQPAIFHQPIMNQSADHPNSIALAPTRCRYIIGQSSINHNQSTDHPIIVAFAPTRWG